MSISEYFPLGLIPITSHPKAKSEMDLSAVLFLFHKFNFSNAGVFKFKDYR